MKDKELLNYSSPSNDKEWNDTKQYKLPNGEYTDIKPEWMTQICENQLVCKTDPKIKFRGRVDTFQAQLIHDMFTIQKSNHSPRLLVQLRELFRLTQEILRSEILNKPLHMQTLLDWSDEEIKKRAHNPQLYYNLQQMIIIDETFKEVVILLNLLRAQVREIELVAVQAFQCDDDPRDDIIKVLNRMSSCFHILMYQEIAYSLD